MNRKVFWRVLLCLVLFFSLRGFSQQARTIKGIVLDSAKAPIIGVIIKLSTPADSLKRSTDLNGNYVISNVKFPSFTLTASYIGYEPFVKTYAAADLKAVVNDTIILRESSSTLGAVIINAIVPVRVKEDTIEYSAAAYPVRDGDAIEEVIKKLPGVTVDKDGNVTAQGKPITRIRVNGKDFFGGDVATAIQSLPADIVKNLQVIDDYGDQAKLTGVKVGEPEKILNINIAPDKNRGYTARGTGGLGNESRFITNVKGTLFNGDRHLAFDGSVNNTNVRGGGGDGITNTKAVKLSYANVMSKKFSVDAGMDFNTRNNMTLSSRFTQSVFPGSSLATTYTRYDDQNNRNISDNKSGSVYGNLEFRPDTVNYFRFSPNFNLNSSTNGSNGFTNTTFKKTSSLRDNTSANENGSDGLGLNLFYNRRLHKKNRNISMSVNANFNDNSNDNRSQNKYTNTDSLGSTSYQNQYLSTGNTNNATRYGYNVTYSEPFGKSTFADLTYNWNYQDNHSEKDTRDVDPVTGNEVHNDKLSNNYRYQFITNRVGLSFRRTMPKYNINMGVSAQPALLKGQDLSRKIDTHNETFIVIPTARFVYRLAKQKSLTLNYNGRSNQPSFTQLQPISDVSNLQNTVSGNPDLNPEYTHDLNLDYNQSSLKDGFNVFANMTYSQTNDKIVTTKVTAPDGIRQLTSYTNTDGFYTMRGNYSVSKPFMTRALTVSWTGGARFSNNVSFTSSRSSGLARDIARNLVLDQGLKVRVFVNNFIDTEVESRYSVNTTNYSQANLSDRRTNSLSLSVNGRNYFFEDLSLGYELSQVVNSGYSSSANVNPTLITMFLEYRFLKGNAANIRFQGFDLLNQNTGISRDVFDNVIVDRQANRLARYFLLSFSMRVKKFGGFKLKKAE